MIEIGIKAYNSDSKLQKQEKEFSFQKKKMLRSSITA